MIFHQGPVDERLQIMVIRRQLESEVATRTASKLPHGAADALIAEAHEVIAIP